MLESTFFYEYETSGFHYQMPKKFTNIYDFLTSYKNIGDLHYYMIGLSSIKVRLKAAIFTNKNLVNSSS